MVSQRSYVVVALLSCTADLPRTLEFLEADRQKFAGIEPNVIPEHSLQSPERNPERFPALSNRMRFSKSDLGR
jgi:hypothetical protein